MTYASFCGPLVATVVFLAPLATNADDAAPYPSITRSDTAEIDGIAIEAHIEHPSAGPRGWFVRVTFTNAGSAPAKTTVAFAANVSIFNPASRSSSAPQAAWVKQEPVSHAAGETRTRTYPLPEALGVRMTEWDRQARAIQKAYDDMAAGKTKELPSWAVGIGAGPRGSVSATVIPTKRG